MAEGGGAAGKGQAVTGTVLVAGAGTGWSPETPAVRPSGERRPAPQPEPSRHVTSGSENGFVSKN
nr:hypothetical protein StreXyl84_67090 [Streptomyces sp. Xyl84]